jgi:alkylation response protein AidB-like acyl-CoA dehydrogenase/enoyl-CoA hydratase/carnithine racemase
MEKVEMVKREILGVIIIKNPPYNILSTPVFRELQQALEELRNDRHIKAVIITGQGLFSAGADVTEINRMAQEGSTSQIRELLDTAHRIVNTIENLGKPVIAAIDGYCLGGGNEIAMACSASVASDQAQFGQPEIKLGIIPGLGGTQRLPRRIGVKRALEMMLVGNIIPAGEALKLGLVDLVVPQANLISRTREFVLDYLEHPLERKKPGLDPAQVDNITAGETYQALMATKSQEAVRALILAVKEGIALPLPQALNLESRTFSQLAITADAREGLAAFIEKRSPRFPSLAGKEEKTAAPEPETPAVLSSDPLNQPEFVALRETVANFARSEIQPNVEKMEADERISTDIIKKMAELGFYGIYYPEKYGGVNMGKTGYCILMEEIARVHGAMGAFLGVHIGLATWPVYTFGTEEQKQKYLVPGIQGEKIGAFALTEPEAGSDAANIQTTAKKKGNKWIINGNKQFITNSDQADFIVVIAQTDKFLGLQGLTAFIIETSWPGFTIDKVENKIGIRAARTCAFVLEDLEVPEENMLGGIGQGFKIFMKTLNGGRLGLGAGCVGAGKEALKMAYDHASQRVQFGRTLLEQEAIQFYFAEMRAKIYLMESAVYRAAAMADQGKDYRMEAAIVKLTCSEMASEIVDKALQIFGGYGYIEDYPIARMYRDARINQIYEGTSEIQKLMIFKEVFKKGGQL